MIEIITSLSGVFAIAQNWPKLAQTGPNWPALLAPYACRPQTRLERDVANVSGLKWLRLSELSFRNKILLLGCSLTLFTALVMGVATTLRTERLVRDFAETNVAHETRLVAQQVMGTYN